MQIKYKKINTSSLRLHERAGAMALLLVTVIGLTSVSHESRRIFRELALRPAFEIINNSGRENETARMPVNYEGAFRWQAISGQ